MVQVAVAGVNTAMSSFRSPSKSPTTKRFVFGVPTTIDVVRLLPDNLIVHNAVGGSKTARSATRSPTKSPIVMCGLPMRSPFTIRKLKVMGHC
jgi:hypothetical protein